MSQEIVQRSPEQQLVLQVRANKEQFENALPPNVTIDRFIRVTTTAILANPEIAKLETGSVLTALVQCAAMGLLPDGKQAAITPRKGKAVLVPMIQGFRDIAADHGWTLRTAVVYSEDEFRHAVVDGDESITHIPVRPGAERGHLIAAYAIARHRDGRKMMVVLHPADIAKRRESSAYDAVWNEHPAAMWEKSAGRDLFGQLGLGELDERVARALAAEQAEPAEASRLIYGNAEPPAALPPASGIEHPQKEMTTGPVADGATDDAGAQQAAAATPPVAAAAPETEEPGPAPAQSSFVAPAGVDEDVAVFQANAAAQMIVPVGKWQGCTLAEVHNAPEGGTEWLSYALSHFDDATGTTPKAEPKYRPGEFVQAVRAFAVVYAPDLIAEAA